MHYAGFWPRFAAHFIDTVVVGIGSFVIGVVINLALLALDIGLGLFALREVALFFVNFIVGLILGCVYSAAMESSPTQGTLGKMALSIQVTDLGGNRISFAQGTGRYFGKIVSGLILCIGFLMVIFTEKKQGLHDKMAGCLVINK